MSHLRARDDAVEVLSSCPPGQLAVVWYSDDSVYHERLMVWRAGDTEWFVLTPDGDFYREDWSGHSDEGPISFKLKKTDFSHFSRISQPVYRFSSYPDDDRFRELVERVR